MRKQGVVRHGKGLSAAAYAITSPQKVHQHDVCSLSPLDPHRESQINTVRGISI